MYNQANTEYKINNKIPALMAVDIMGSGEVCSDGFHYKRYINIIVDDEPVKRKVTKVMYGFPSEEVYNYFIDCIDASVRNEYTILNTSVLEAYYRPANKAKTISSYNKLLYLIDLYQSGFDFLSDSMLVLFERDINIVNSNIHHFDRTQRKYAEYAAEDAERIIQILKTNKPKSLIQTLKEKHLI